MSLTKKDLEDLVKKYQADLATVNIKLSKLNNMLSAIDDMKKMLTANREENERLKKHLLNWNFKISKLQANLIMSSSIIRHGASGWWDSPRAHSLLRRRAPGIWVHPLAHPRGCCGRGWPWLCASQFRQPSWDGPCTPRHRRSGQANHCKVRWREMMGLVFRHKKSYAP